MDLILSDSLITHLPNGNRIFLTNRLGDRAYAHLINQSEILQVSQLAEELDSIEPTLKTCLATDQRIAIDEAHNVVLLEDIGFKRLDGTWFLNLAPIQDSPDLDNEVIIPLSTLVNSVLTGLSAKGIHDATVWGVFRYLSELLEYEYRSAFPLGINEVILADILVAHSGGRIRNMRRRRLRWDDEEAPAALGKSGWIAKCVRRVNLAITTGELDELLRESYQDYASYVLEQLTPNEQEEGSGFTDFEIVKIARSGIPMIVTPPNHLAEGSNETCSELVIDALDKLSPNDPARVKVLNNAWLMHHMSGPVAAPTLGNVPLEPPKEDRSERSSDDEGPIRGKLTDTSGIPLANIPMVQAVFDLLLEEGEPMRIGPIRKRLIERGVAIPGQGKDANIIVNLRSSKDFCRTSVGTYALSQWGLATIDKPRVRWKKTGNSDTTLATPGRSMQIYEAAYQVLSELGEPAHISIIRELIESKGYFEFGAKDPDCALRVAIDRHANNVEISKPAQPTLFSRFAPAIYGLIEWDGKTEHVETSDPQNVVANIDANTWFQLSHWAKVNDQLQPKERSLAYSIGKVLSQGSMPSPKQANWAVEILQRAREAGFSEGEGDAKPSGSPNAEKPNARADSVNEVLASFILGE